ncbi:peptide chain release factor-like protein [Actinoplanes solisilvae]|uniref:peptide chain release factor-like protein n=1 Tax=Actinoplanes solisilvae TaxID=2486853 RepID=UPI000FDB93D9|nr:peptide chain release factor-like protein [Actinoplanes solisilvae]
MTTYLLLSSGRGPRECEWAVAEIAKKLEAATRTARLETVPGEHPGTFRSILFEIEDDEVARTWTGTLCWQAPSPYRSGIGRKNWYVTAQPCTLETESPAFDEDDVDMVPIRTGGPGGQHRNKASTAVRATHRPSGLVVVVDTERQLSLNRKIALRLLRERLESAGVAAERDAITARWRVHDDLVRGNPARTFRASDPRGTRSPRPARDR